MRAYEGAQVTGIETTAVVHGCRRKSQSLSSWLVPLAREPPRDTAATPRRPASLLAM
jgi:hypothetical protein